MANRWVSAARLRTLPLSFGSILLGSLLAAHYGSFSLSILLLSLLTTLLLQVLSNYANDLGDTLHGADAQRKDGPQRMVQAGLITISQMRNAVYVTGSLAFATGVALLVVANLSQSQWLAFLLLGLASIAAAYLYTNGYRPYGYLGLGDIFVFLFFGIIGVGGPFYLITHQWHQEVLLPATAAGLLATGVLNLNNMRDIETDRAAGKLSIPARLGFAWAKVYHLSLLLAVLGCLGCFAFFYVQIHLALLLAILSLILLLIIQFIRVSTPAQAGSLLPRLAMAAFVIDLLFGIGVAGV